MKTTMRQLKKVHLVKITIVAAFDGEREEAGFEAMAEAAADMLRDEALVVESSVESVERELLDPHVVDGQFELVKALAKEFPDHSEDDELRREQEHYPVPTGLQRRPGVEYGCGQASCADCYEPRH